MVLKKIINSFKIAFSSKYFWIVMIVTYFAISLSTYVFMKYFYSLMIVNPEYLFFWKPQSYYYNQSPFRYGFAPWVHLFICLFLMFLLYKSNVQKKVSSNYGFKFFLFIFLYVAISYPQSTNSPNVMTKMIYNFPFSPIENFMKDTKIDFMKETVKTPFGTFKIYKKSESLPDLLFSLQLKCKEDLARGGNGSCVRYPFK